jgi:superoxide dismutase, Cu-Zn family
MRHALAALLATAVAGSASAADAPIQARVELKTAAGAAAGTAVLTEAPNGVLLRLEARGLPPGWHGLHFHEKADCSKADFTSAGGHVHGKPTMVHGLLNPDANEAGDLPNLHVDAHGEAAAEMFSGYVSLTDKTGRQALMDADGSALVLHAAADDHRSQPIGGAGARIACGAIPAG